VSSFGESPSSKDGGMDLPLLDGQDILDACAFPRLLPNVKKNMFILIPVCDALRNHMWEPRWQANGH
jgi:hypothetical protein